MSDTGTTPGQRRGSATKLLLIPWLSFAAFAGGCGEDPPYQLPVDNSGLSWFPLEPASLQLVRGDSTVLLLAVRDSTGDTLPVAKLPDGHFAVESRDAAIVTVRAGTADSLLAIFRVQLRADAPGTDTLRFALLGIFCLQRASLFTPPQCFTGAWFPAAELPILVH